MIRKLWILLILGSISSFGHAQKQAANWYFGENAGLKFGGCGNPPTAISGQLNTKEGSTSISDEDGNLLFYTDGITVYNKNDNVLQNGDNLFGNPSSAQSAIIVPKPGDPNIYYIFTVDTVVQQGQTSNGFNYSEVDMSLNNGLGGITSKNNNLLRFSSEKITSTFKNPDGSKIWVITFASTDGTSDSVYVGNDTYNPAAYNTFHVFEIDSNGINTNSIKSPSGVGNVGDRRGYLKISPDGKKLVCANTSSGTYLYDFDVETGQVFNPVTLNLVDTSSGNWASTNQGYGVEFSPNSKYLYVTAWNGSGTSSERSILYQFDLSDANLPREIIDRQSSLFRGALQLGPDGKIYRAMSQSYDIGLPYLGVINSPNENGINCDYIPQGLSLANGTLSTQGLPPFIQSYFFNTIDVFIDNTKKESSALCNNDIFKLDLGNDLLITFPNVICNWYFNNTPIPGNTVFQDNLTQPGVYRVEIDPNDGIGCSYSREIEITFDPLPEVFSHEIAQCAMIGNTKSIFSFPETLPDPDTLPYYDYVEITCDGDPNCIQNILNNPLDLEYFEDNMANVRITSVNLSNYESEAKTIWVRTRNTNSESQCASELKPLILRVNPLGNLNTTTTALVIAECNINDDDVNGNARGDFNLDRDEIKQKLVNNPNFGLDPGLINDYNYSFYEVLEDAQLRNSNAIDVTSTYLSKAKDIFIRVDDLSSSVGCVGISKIKLIIEEGDISENYSNDDLVVCKTYDDVSKNSITLNALDNLDPNASYAYEWVNDITGEVISNDKIADINLAGTYTYTIYKTHLANKKNYAYDITCETSGSVTINPSEIAVFETPAFETTDGKDYNSITVYVNGDGVYEYALFELINGKEYEIEDYQTSNIFNNIQAGNFRVYVRDTKYTEDIDVGCGLTEGLVSIIGFPKFFTPRKNGKNDFWQIKGAGLQPDSKVEIYNRYGKLIQELAPNMQGWDGTYKGNPMPANDYWFKALLQDGRVIYDHFSLVR